MSKIRATSVKGKEVSVLAKTCRTCASFYGQESNLVSIFSEAPSGALKHLEFTIFDELAAIDVFVEEDDGLPQKICKQCVAQLQNIQRFRELCLNSEQVLRKHFSIFKKPTDVQNKKIKSELKRKENELKTNNSKFDFIDVTLENMKTEDTSFDTNDDTFEVHSTDDNTDDTINTSIYDVTTNDDLPYSCWYCEKYFNSFYDLRKHERNNHENRVIKREEKEIKLEPSSEKKMDSQCEYCGQIFEEITFLKRHLRIHVIGPLSKNGNQSQYVRNYVCPFAMCKKLFIIPQGLEKHMKLHDQSRKYRCSQCDLGYNRSEHLQRHINHAHSKSITFTCHICLKVFLHEHVKNRHLKMHQTSERYKCNRCNKTFLTSQYLEIHERLHTGEKPVVCVICGESFIHNNYLKSHQRKHTKEEHEVIRKKIVYGETNLTHEKEIINDSEIMELDTSAC